MPRQVDECWPRALKESGDAMKKQVFKTRSPTLVPQGLERSNDAGGAKRMALPRHASKGISNQQPS
jgi:hypothetical protein